MITWRSEREIAVNIEEVWELFNDDQIQRIMPNVVEHVLLEKKPGMVGSNYKQSYKEGKRVETYVVTVLEFEETETRKHQKWSFVLGKAFEIEFSFTLTKLDEGRTRFLYEGQNKGINFLGRVLMKLGEKSNNKVVQDFMDTVEREALKQNIRT
ncbi:SRPBCC family protein [Fictibacillus aquaticus]|uniref:SRPBCC family protein n=1 Tax=Fictibacillus aquaticus TaxID=2021314 RepID=A0A235F5Z5_9BACL|nr:SRPBCC family protein [Fictibacillus aquaticus]OYD56652.1 hypothetical protein CGZ90_16715 [Fictibacillus aquaticus]